MLADATFGPDAPASLDIEQAALVRVGWNGATLRARLHTVDLAQCDLANADLTGSWWYDVVATDCRMTGVTFGKANITRVMFDTCAMSLVSFREAKLEQVVFKGCDLAGVDLGGASLTDVRFDGCDLDGFIARGSSFERVDLSGSTLGSAVDVATLRGTTIDVDQLMVLALQLTQRHGLEVADADADGH